MMKYLSKQQEAYIFSALTTGKDTVQNLCTRAHPAKKYIERKFVRRNYTKRNERKYLSVSERSDMKQMHIINSLN